MFCWDESKDLRAPYDYGYWANRKLFEVVSQLRIPGRVEDWRRCSVGPAYLLLPVSVGSASLSGP